MNFSLKLLLAILGAIPVLSSYSQLKKISGNSSFTGDYSHFNYNEPNSVQQVDSIANTRAFYGGFASVYSKSMKHISAHLASLDSGARAFIQKFEIYFANYFVDAYHHYQEGILDPQSEWSAFFSHPLAKSWQTVLLGANAHINIDLSQALIHNFSLREIEKYKHSLLAAQHSIAAVYYLLFYAIIQQNNYVRFMDSFTKGAPRVMGERWLYKWRSRSVKLAILFYKKPHKFKRKLRQVARKKKKIDRIILSQK